MNPFERWQDLSFDPPGPFGWVFVVLGLAAVAYAVFVYRRTDAPLTPRFRALLMALRAALLLLLIAVLCRPVLSVALPGGADRGVLLLLDRSRSMALPGAADGESREDELARARATLEPRLRDAYPLTVLGFDTAPREIPADGESLPAPAGDATNLAAALEGGVALSDGAARPGAVVLVTDGVATDGPDPLPAARRLGVPVAAVALGADAPVPDLTLVRVRANRDAFLGERAPIEAVVRLQGLPAQDVEVTLTDVTGEPDPLVAERVRLDGAGAERRVSLAFEPRAAGLRFLEVRVAPAAGESTPANNRRLVAVDVREQKTGVLLLSGALTWDHTFVRRAVEADSTLETTSGYWRDSGFMDAKTGSAIDSPAPAGLRRWALLILDRVTPRQLGAGGAEAVAGFVRAGGGLILIAGADDDALARWRGTALEALLPVTIEGGGARDAVEARPGPAAARSALFDPTLPGAPPLEAWAGLPPIAPSPGLGSLKGHAEALLVGGGGAEPLLAWAPADQGRVLLLGAGGVWRWDFLNPSLRPSGNIMPAWWRRAAQWMARPEVETRLDVHPVESVFRRGEAARFAARALDEAYRPLPGVAVDVEITLAGGGTAEPRRIALGGGEGFLSGAAEGLPPGRYRYRAEARGGAGGAPLGVVEGHFAVDSLGAEMERLEADHELLARLGRATGGGFWRADSLEGLPAALELAAGADAERRQVDLWDHPVTFALFVLLGSSEWILRRRRGLI